MRARACAFRAQFFEKEDQGIRNRMKSFRWIATLVVALIVQVRAAEPLSDWLLPNLGARLTIQVSNPSPEPVKMLATIPTADARKVALEFPCRLSFALLL